MPVDTQVQEAAAAASTHGSGANDARYDSLLFPRRHHRHRRALALRQCCVIVALRTNGAYTMGGTAYSELDSLSTSGVG